MASEKGYTCCFVGPDKLVPADVISFYARIGDLVEKLIVEKKVNAFLFETKKGFEGICFDIVSALRLQYPHIRRIKMKKEKPSSFNDFFFGDHIDGFDDVCYPGRILHDWKTIYKGQDAERIDLSGFCIICYDENNDCSKRETRLSVEYAKRKDVCIINVGE